MLGVDHFALYDSDGSAKSEFFGVKVSYFPYWPRQLSAKLAEIAESSHCRHCLSSLAEVGSYLEMLLKRGLDGLFQLRLSCLKYLKVSLYPPI